MQEVIDEITRYMQDFIEKPNPAFGGMPVCPFATKVRIEGRIDFQIAPFSINDVKDGSEMLGKIRTLAEQDHFDIIMFVHPDKKAMTFEELDVIIKAVQEMVKPDFHVFSGHPDDPYQMHGIFTRRDPYPNFQVITAKLLNEAAAKLANTKYYNPTKE